MDVYFFGFVFKPFFHLQLIDRMTFHPWVHSLAAHEGPGYVGGMGIQELQLVLLRGWQGSAWIIIQRH